MSNRERNTRTQYRHIKWVIGLLLIQTGLPGEQEWLGLQLEGLTAEARRPWLKALAKQMLAGKTCWFCHSELVHQSSDSWWTAPEVTIHHVNGNHADDSPRNHELAHAACHRRHHLADRKATARHHP